MGKTETYVFREGTQGQEQASEWRLGSEGKQDPAFWGEARDPALVGSN